MKTYVKTYGCQMNLSDSETAMGVLRQSSLGVEFIDDWNQADLILMNTCSIRQHAEDRVLGQLGRLKEKKEQNPALIIGLLGCMAAEHKGHLIKRFPHIDFVCTQRDVDQIPSYVADALEKRKNVSIVKTGLGSRLSRFGYRTDPVRAFVTITHGCDNHCSYCIVPYVRGREISRPTDEILEELSYLRDQGMRQIILLGQNVNSYGKGLPNGENFVTLLEAATRIEGLELFEFMTPHPHDVSYELIDLIAENPKISKHLHFPAQSGSNRILQKMRRDYTREEYLKKAAYFKQKMPHGSLTTDLIVGFCGETEEDFEQTLSLMQEVVYDNAYIFKYSPRQKTFAYKWEDDVPDPIKEERNARALILQQSLSEAKYRTYIGLKLKALVAKESKKSPEEFLAVTWNDQLVLVPKDSLKLGDLFELEIESRIPDSNTFRGHNCGILIPR